MNAKLTRGIAIGVILLGIGIMAVLIWRTSGRDGDATSPGGGNPAADETVRIRTLSETSQARFISIIPYESGHPAVSYMASSGTNEFDELAAAVTDAAPVDGAADETFATLLVVSFGRGDTLDMSYSSRRNLILLEDQAYRPKADLQQIIERVRLKTDNP